MENKYSGDISDFAKYVMLKNLFNDKKIGFVWYLTPDRNEPEYSNKFKVFEKNVNIYEYACSIDKNIAFQFNFICKKDACNFYVKKLENLDILDNVVYFNTSIVGVYPDGKNYRKEWLNNALDKIKYSNVVYLDPDYGLPIDYRISVLKPFTKINCSEKYITIEEIKEFFLGKDVVIFHNRYPVGIEHKKVHSTVFNKVKKTFKKKYVYILKQNPFMQRFFVIISRYDLTDRLKKLLISNKLCNIKPFKGFFTLIMDE